MTIAFDNSYAALPARFSARVAPSAAVHPRLIRFNSGLAARLGLDLQQADETGLAQIFSGQTVPAGAEPLAMAYAGHQFGHFVPQLGDGRAILLGEVIGCDGLRYDIQLKGSGQTPFSRRGDGRAALGPVLREYIVSEAMAAMGVPTTRSLAAVATGDTVYRETPLPGAILTRVARSHLRVGTFQYFAARQDVEALKALTAYAIERHYPKVADAENRALALLDAVVAAQASLIARWMSVGFIHGVMNTDNMAISGETIDYGPCAFMDAYHPNTVFSSIDEHGRYAFANQPRIAQWNLARLAETLLPLIDADGEAAVARATQTLNAFGSAFEGAFLKAFRAKLGLTMELPEDLALIQSLLTAMAQGGADFTLTFRALAGPGAAAARDCFSDPANFDTWAETWRARMSLETITADDRHHLMLSANPAYIPRNHRIEAVIQAATASADFAPFHEMVDLLSRPFDEQPGREAYALGPAPEERVERTFCGT
jgi:serine/tyrosine/threonine adenylyltransferase